jgi:superfamily I DNA and/or RNA helicase
MVPAIGNLISQCFYDGELENGEVERKPVDDILLTFKTRSVVWLSTREFEHRSEQQHDRGVYVNPCEAEEILDQLHDLARMNNGNDTLVTVLVISGYQAQAKHMAREIGREQSRLSGLRVECCTIDAVQGREADVVFFSVTRSNEHGQAGFLDSSQRINVALSRAQKLLVIVGDDGFVMRAKDCEPLQRVLTHIRCTPDECLYEDARPRLKIGGAR